MNPTLAKLGIKNDKDLLIVGGAIASAIAAFYVFGSRGSSPASARPSDASQLALGALKPVQYATPLVGPPLQAPPPVAAPPPPIIGSGAPPPIVVAAPAAAGMAGTRAYGIALETREGYSPAAAIANTTVSVDRPYVDASSGRSLTPGVADFLRRNGQLILGG